MQWGYVLIDNKSAIIFDTINASLSALMHVVNETTAKSRLYT